MWRITLKFSIPADVMSPIMPSAFLTQLPHREFFFFPFIQLKPPSNLLNLLYICYNNLMPIDTVKGGGDFEKTNPHDAAIYGHQK